MFLLLFASIFSFLFGDGGHLVAETTAEFQQFVYERVEEIRYDNTYDVLEIEDMIINWRDIVAVHSAYTTRINTNPDVSVEDVIGGEVHTRTLSSIMHNAFTISYALETREQEQTIIDDDGNETTEEITVIVLRIWLEQMSSDQLASIFSFTLDQRELLRDFLSPHNDDFWEDALGVYMNWQICFEHILDELESE